MTAAPTKRQPLRSMLPLNGLAGQHDEQNALDYEQYVAELHFVTLPLTPEGRALDVLRGEVLARPSYLAIPTERERWHWYGLAALIWHRATAPDA
jgi:hypothetical protein